VTKTGRSKSADKSDAGLSRSGVAPRFEDASGAEEGEAESPSAEEYRKARQKVERLEAVSEEVVKRLDTAIASIASLLRRR
jgi:predicted transcriptional regulator